MNPNSTPTLNFDKFPVMSCSGRHSLGSGKQEWVGSLADRAGLHFISNPLCLHNQCHLYQRRSDSFNLNMQMTRLWWLSWLIPVCWEAGLWDRLMFPIHSFLLIRLFYAFALANASGRRHCEYLYLCTVWITTTRCYISGVVPIRLQNRRQRRVCGCTVLAPYQWCRLYTEV